MFDKVKEFVQTHNDCVTGISLYKFRELCIEAVLEDLLIKDKPYGYSVACIIFGKAYELGNSIGGVRVVHKLMELCSFVSYIINEIEEGEDRLEKSNNKF